MSEVDLIKNGVTESELLQLATVITAAALGKPVQARRKDGSPWHRKTFIGHWNPKQFEYRLQPEPRECWVNILSSDSQGYPNEQTAWEAMNPDTKYDAVGVHMREVMDDEDT